MKAEASSSSSVQGPAATAKEEDEVRVLRLERDRDGTSTLYRLKPGWSLVFNPGASLLGRSISVWTNYPAAEPDTDGEVRLRIKLFKETK